MNYTVLALPRSRTAWLSRFLTYGEWHCGHETLCDMRSLSDIRAALAKPNSGTAETSASGGWRMIADAGVKIVTVRRPVDDVMRSLLAIRGVNFDAARLRRVIERADRKLDQIERRIPVMSVRFDDLQREDVCKAVFEHCLPYAHDHANWKRLDARNIQIDVPALFQRMAAAQCDLQELAASARRAMLNSLTHNRRNYAWQR